MFKAIQVTLREVERLQEVLREIYLLCPGNNPGHCESEVYAACDKIERLAAQAAKDESHD